MAPKFTAINGKKELGPKGTRYPGLKQRLGRKAVIPLAATLILLGGVKQSMDSADFYHDKAAITHHLQVAGKQVLKTPTYDANAIAYYGAIHDVNPKETLKLQAIHEIAKIADQVIAKPAKQKLNYDHMKRTSGAFLNIDVNPKRFSPTSPTLKEELRIAIDQGLGRVASPYSDRTRRAGDALRKFREINEKNSLVALEMLKLSQRYNHNY